METKLEELKKLKDGLIKEIEGFSNQLKISEANFLRVDGAIFVLEELLKKESVIKE